MSNLKYTFEEAKEILRSFGYEYLSGEYKGVCSILVCIDNNGYYVRCSLDKLINSGKRPLVVSTSNPYTLCNINKYVKTYTDDEYECISDTYISNDTDLEFKHNVCGRIFKNKWRNITRKRYLTSYTSNRTGLFCPHCNTKQLESTHALVLKQVWLHEENDTITEDVSCINPNTNHVMPTDIVNHRLKIAIEIQSWFHDFEDAKIKDSIKKQFWIDKGYDFYAVDQRDYTVLEMIQIFFPNINKIPDYIDFEYSNKFNDVEAQKLLNKYKSIPKVAKLMNISTHIIYDAIYNKRLEYPNGYINDCNTPVVQLDLDLNYVNSYNSLKEASDITGCKNISECLLKKRNYSGGYYWVKKSDYDSWNFTIAIHRSAKFNKPVNQFSLDGNFIKRFDSIKDAYKETGARCTDIYKVTQGTRRSCGGYIWKLA